MGASARDRRALLLATNAGARAIDQRAAHPAGTRGDIARRATRRSASLDQQARQRGDASDARRGYTASACTHVGHLRGMQSLLSVSHPCSSPHRCGRPHAPQYGCSAIDFAQDPHRARKDVKIPLVSSFVIRVPLTDATHRVGGRRATASPLPTQSRAVARCSAVVWRFCRGTSRRSCGDRASQRRLRDRVGRGRFPW